MQSRRLRTRSGCLVCRWRRKKCDESRPVCGSCQRLGLSCKWHTASVVSAHEKPKDETAISHLAVRYGAVLSRPPVTRVIGQTSTLFSSQAQFDLMSFWPALYRNALAPYATSRDTDISNIMTMAMSQAILRSAVAAFVGFVIISTTEANDALEEAAIDSYQESVIDLKKMVRDPQDEPGLAIVKSIAIGHLAMSEAAHFGNTSNAFHHFHACLYLFPSLLSQPGGMTAPSIILEGVEAYLLQAAGIAMFWDEKQLTTLLLSIQWDRIDHALSWSPNSSKRSCKDSGLVGIPHQILILIFQSTAAVRQIRGSFSWVLDPIRWERQLARIESSLAEYYHGLPQQDEAIGLAFSNLFLDMLRVHARIRADPCGKSLSDVPSQIIIDRALQSLAWIQSNAQITNLLFWPLVVLLSGVQDTISFERLVAQGQQFRFSKGLTHLWARVVGANREHRTEKNSNGSDGLGLFVRKDGIMPVQPTNVETSGQQPPVARRSATLWVRQ